MGSSTCCPHCRADARFAGYRPRTVLTLTGAVALRRGYHRCPSCHQGHCPTGAAAGLRDGRPSPGLRPLVCLAGTLGAFRDAADDLRRRSAGARLSACGVRRAAEAAGERLRRRQAGGAVVRPEALPPWDFRVEGHGAAEAPAWPGAAGRGGAGGPTEAACKVVGSRLKGSGMRWLGAGAAQVAPLRALHQSGHAAWDAFWPLAV